MQIVSDNTCAAASGDFIRFNRTSGRCELITDASYAGLITEDMVCGRNPGRSSCQGDSGGPFTVNEDDQHILVGVVSWANGCGEVR